MAALTDGYFYFIESEAADNQNWLPTPDNIVIGNFTEGTDYCKLQIPSTFQSPFTTGAVINTGSDGNQYMNISAKRAYKFLLDGIETSVSNANTIDKFIMSDRHTSGIPASRKWYYLIVRFGASNYVKFTDGEGTQRDYCRGIIMDGVRIWNKSDNFRVKVHINFGSVW